MVEKPFGVILEKKRHEGKNKYGVFCTWFSYKLPKTRDNKAGIKLMEKFLEENDVPQQPKKRHKPSSQQSLLL